MDMQRPLVVRFGALGDMVFLTVVIRTLHRRFGLPVDVLASGPWTRPLLFNQPGVGDIHVIGSRRLPYWLSLDQQSLVRRLSARGRGPTWIAESDAEKSLSLLHRAGWIRDDISTMSDVAYVPGAHYCDYLDQFAHQTPAVLGGLSAPIMSNSAPHCFLEVSQHEREQLGKWLQARGLNRPCILIQAGNKRTMRRGPRRRARASNTKYWSEKNWASVLRGLRERHKDHALLLLGAPQEIGLNEDILRIAAVSDAHNLARDLPIPRLMALSERATGMIAVDTGPGHVAAAVGCRVVTLFGAGDPKGLVPRGPRCPGTPVVGMVDGQQSMRGITPEQVLAAWGTAIHAP